MKENMRFIYFGILLPVLINSAIFLGQTPTPPISTEIALANARSDIRDKGAQPFHLVAMFDADGNVEFTGHGSYEESWIDADHWQRKVELGSYRAIETQNGDQHGFSATSEYVPKRVASLVQVLQFQQILNRRVVKDDQWKATEPSTDSLQYERSTNGVSSKYVFETLTNRVLQTETSGSARKYQEYLEFSGHVIPGEVRVFTGAGQEVLTVRIMKLEPLTAGAFLPSSDRDASPNKASTLLLPEPATNGEVPPKVKKAVDPKFPRAEQRRPGMESMAIVDAAVDRNGAIREAEIVNVALSDFAQAALEAVKKYKMEPASLQGNPIETVIKVEVILRVRY
ncbi:MAG TPA: energy transducer TonB [Pseudacidobacterium sp.]|jgi:hypothetical protein|nr:energy transducer TonB [Pseudacidobacterium sp.]